MDSTELMSIRQRREDTTNGAAGAAQVNARKLLLGIEAAVQYSKMSATLYSAILAIRKGFTEIDAHACQGYRKLSKVQVQIREMGFAEVLW